MSNESRNENRNRNRSRTSAPDIGLGLRLGVGLGVGSGLRVLVLFLLIPASRAEPAEPFRAGLARVDITPEVPLRLLSTPANMGPAAELDQRLHARVLVLEDSSGVASVLVSLDGSSVPAGLRQRICGNLRPRFGIYRVRVAVCATGAETTPILEGGIGAGATVEERAAIGQYTRFVSSAILKAITEAHANRRPVRLQFGRAPDPGAGGERATAAGSAGWPYLALRRAEDGRLAALIFGMTRRATSEDPSANRLSSGWSGRTVSALEQTFEDVLVLPLAGLDSTTPPRADESKRAFRALRDRMRTAASGAPDSGVAARLDCRFEYASLAHSDGSLKVPVQVWSVDGEPRILFHAGRGDSDLEKALRSVASSPDALWVVGVANAPTGLLPSVRRPDAPEALVTREWSADERESWLRHLRSFLADDASGIAARVKPPASLSPREALKTFRLEPRLKIELAASEPQVSDPVAIAFGADGALFVCEMHDYPLGRKGSNGPEAPEATSEGRLRRLEDRDGDGFYERAGDFATALPYVNGVACHRDGVFVTARTSVIYLKDGDGDGRAEIRRTVFEGFRPGNSQHLVNTLEWGLDNWIHANGGDGAAVRRVGVAGARPIQLRYQNFRFHPDSLRIEATSGYRGGFGIAVNDRGVRFVCDNQNHACQVVLPRRALLRNPQLGSDRTMETISETGSRVYPASRPLERFNDPFDVGRFSSACGVHVYGGDRLPQEYRGNVFTCEPVGNLVHREELRLEGSRYRSRRVDHEREFLASTDYWFRPVNATTGPDGALYICDMYREVIEHPQWIPLHVQKLFDLRSGSDRGRIYRISARGEPSRGGAFLDGASPRELVEMLGDPVSWRRRTAQRLLVEGRGPEIAVELRRLAANEASSALARVHALCTLDGLDRLDPKTLAGALRDPSERVREQGARLVGEALERGPTSELGEEALANLVAPLASLADDPAANVRFQVALALGNASGTAPLDALVRISRRDSADAFTRSAILSSIGQNPVSLLEGLVVSGDDAPSGTGARALVVEILDIVARREDPREIYHATEILSGLRGDWPAQVAFRLLKPLGPGGSMKLVARARDEMWTVPSGREPGAVEAVLKRWFAGVEARLADGDLEVEARREAMELVALARPSRARSALTPYVDNREPGPLQITAIRGLAGLPPPAAAEITALFLERLPRLTPPVQREVLDALLRSPSRAGYLLDALEREAFSPRVVSLTHRATLVEHPDPLLRERARRLFAENAVTAERAAVVREYRLALLDLPERGDADRGKALFEKTCGSCHRVAGLGNAIGPDLVALASRERDALLLDILDPNRAVDSKYLNYLVILEDGRIVNGLISSETVATVVLRLADGKTEIIPRPEIRELRASGKSLMPEGLEQELDPRQLVDLLTFLRSAAGLSP